MQAHSFVLGFFEVIGSKKHMRFNAMLEKGDNDSLIAIGRIFDKYAREADKFHANGCATPEDEDAINMRLGATARTLIEAAVEIPPRTEQGRATIKRMLAHLDRWDGTSTADRLATSEDLADKLVGALLRGIT